jgi:peptidoglycan/xylan/chitin deacetylase (PgdA/CDA1 family)
MRVALRVDVQTLRGLREGVPNLMRLFSEFQVRASFFFPMGRDLSGRRPVQAWRSRRHLGFASLAYGTLLIPPALGRVSKQWLVTARQNGHEVGLFGLSPLIWARRLAHAESDWVQRECGALWARYTDEVADEPIALATPAWQINPALMAELDRSRFAFSSLTRGKLPYRPILQGERSGVPEIPTTLPTVDEMLQHGGVNDHNVHEFLYAESCRVLPAGHVFAASAEREGLDRLGLMEKLLVMWKGQEGSLRALGDLLQEADMATLPEHQIGWGRVTGSTDHMAIQSIEVPQA